MSGNTAYLNWDIIGACGGIMDIITAITTSNQLYSLVKGLREIDRKIDSAVLKADLAEVQIKMSEVKIALMEARDALAERDQQIAELKASFDTKAELVRLENGFHYLPDDLGRPIGCPVCPSCLVDKQRITETLPLKSSQCKCPSCDKEWSGVEQFLTYEPGKVQTRSERNKIAAERNSAAIGRTLARSSNRW